MKIRKCIILQGAQHFVSVHPKYFGVEVNCGAKEQLWNFSRKSVAKTF